ncbi:SRPBCC family protein [Catenulispora rubra]|uniref:SRPBCC family protein n=1 Tax=Catenulispora rubra TaxID=280293 RepID=UPI001892190F|nr:SRPBCC family protein [Catenulispora rubra]
MYQITAEAEVRGDIAVLWTVATDVDNRPSWDPHEQEARLDGPFEAGAVGWSKPNGGPATEWTVTEAEAPHRFGSECALPGGRIRGLNTFEVLPGGRVRCVKTVWVTGPLVPLFRLHFGRRMRRDMLLTFAALEAEAARRAGRAGGEQAGAGQAGAGQAGAEQVDGDQAGGERAAA